MKKFALLLLAFAALLVPNLSQAQLAQRDSGIIGTYLVGFGPKIINAVGTAYFANAGVEVTLNGGFARAVVAYDTDGFHKVLFSRVRLFFNGKMFTTSGEGVIMPYNAPGSPIPNNPKNRDQDVYVGPVTVSEGVRDPDGVGPIDGPTGNPPSCSLLFTGRVPFGKTKFMDRAAPVMSGEVSYATNLDVTAYVTVTVGADGTTTLVTCNQAAAIPFEMKKMTSAIGGGFRASPKVYR
jgi:hypothetical protein